MRELIRKILKEDTENDYSWVDDYVHGEGSVPKHLLDNPLVVITNPGAYYPTYYDIAIRLGIPLKCEEQVGVYMYKYCYNYFKPEKGDMCVIVNRLEYGGTYYRLYRISDGKETVMNARGFRVLD